MSSPSTMMPDGRCPPDINFPADQTPRLVVPTSLFRQSSPIRGRHSSRRTDIKAVPRLGWEQNDNSTRRIRQHQPRRGRSDSHSKMSSFNLVGGWLNQFYDYWCNFTSDPFNLAAVQGYRLEFDPQFMPPKISKPYFQYKSNETVQVAFSNEIAKLFG